MAETASGVRIESFTAGDGYCWQYRHYPAGGSPRALVVCLHGIQSHGGWYEHSCNRLREAGFSVCFLDRRGSGLNAQDRGDAPGFRRLLDDVAEFLYSATGLHPGVPRFLVAISWGGKLGVALQRRHPGLTDGLALLCPGFFPRLGPPLRRRLAIVLARLVRPRMLFPIPLNDPELFTETPRWQQFIRDDPLSLRQATARLLIESVRLDGYVRFLTDYVQLPVLVMLAEKDRIIDNERTLAYVGRFDTIDKEVLIYPGAHHTLEFEPDPERFIADLRGWIEGHLSAGRQAASGGGG